MPKEEFPKIYKSIRQRRFVCLFMLLWVSIYARSSTDLYQRLGLSNTKCSPKEIQKAYRKKALQHHPDKVAETNRERAEEEFKKIGEAYTILSDPEKRKLYDSYGDAAIQPNFNPPFATPGGSTTSNPFGSSSSSSSSQTFFFRERNPLFGSTYSSRSRPSSPFSRDEFLHFDLQDILQSLHRQQHSSGDTQAFNPSSHFESTAPSSYERNFYCSLEDLCNPRGCKKKLKITFPPSSSRRVVVDPWSNTDSRSTIYTINVQPGWKAGTRVTFKSNPQKGIPPITFILKEKPHAFFTRQNYDLFFTCTIQYNSNKEAHLGGIHIHVPPLPDGQGSLDIHIPNGDERLPIKDGQLIRIPGRGMYIKGGPKRGDLIIRFSLVASTTRST